MGYTIVELKSSVGDKYPCISYFSGGIIRQLEKGVRSFLNLGNGICKDKGGREHDPFKNYP